MLVDFNVNSTRKTTVAFDMEHDLMDPSSSVEMENGGGAFICTECGDGFSQYPELVSHLLTHGPLDSFPYSGSSSSFGSPLEFALHENGTLTVVDRASQPNLSSFGKPPPSNSSQTFPAHQDKRPSAKSTGIGISINTSQHPSPAQYQCNTCGEYFKSQVSLQQHQQYHNFECGYKCTLCCKVFTERSNLREHLQDHAHERFYSCGHCGKRFLKQETLITHRKERHGSPGFRPLSKFADDQDNSVEKSYLCKLCGLHFFWLSDLQSHLLNHSHERKVSAFTTPEIHQQAQQDEQSRDSQYSNGTSIEVKTFIKTDSTRSTSTFRPFRCGLCGDRFQQLSDLKEHHISHQTQEEIAKSKMESEIVPKRQIYGGYNSVLSKPGKVGRPPRGRPSCVSQANHNTKVYPCKHCHRVFVHSSSLSRHMRYHKGTLHTCVFCGRHFPQRCDVRRHIAMYHKLESESKAGQKAMALESRENNVPRLPKLPSSEDQKDIVQLETKPKRFLENDCLDEERQLESQTSENVLSSKEISSSPKPRVTFKCRECGKSFGLLCVYQRHLRYHRREPGGEMHKCPQCPRSFRQSSAMNRHLENHQSQSTGKPDIEGQGSPDDSNEDPDLAVLDEDDDEDQGDMDGDVVDIDDEESIPAEVLYECTECTQTFSCLQTFLQHQNAHGSDNLDNIR